MRSADRSGQRRQPLLMCLMPRASTVYGGLHGLLTTGRRGAAEADAVAVADTAGSADTAGCAEAGTSTTLVAIVGGSGAAVDAVTLGASCVAVV